MLNEFTAMEDLKKSKEFSLIGGSWSLNLGLGLVLGIVKCQLVLTPL